MLDLSDTLGAPSEVLKVYDLGIAPYAYVQQIQARLRADVSSGSSVGALLLLEHEPVITIGAHADTSDLLGTFDAEPPRIPVFRSERGGQTTLHAPGQLISYPVVRIPRRDLRAYVHDLEQTLLLVLLAEGLEAERIVGRPGLYLQRRKIASVGLRCEQGVASHGTALNVNVDLSLFGRIVSCGDPQLRQTSMQQASGHPYSMHDIKERYMTAFQQVFGLTLARPLRLAASQLADLLT